MLFVDGVIVFICAKNDVVNVTVITHFFVCYYVYFDFAIAKLLKLETLGYLMNEIKVRLKK